MRDGRKLYIKTAALLISAYYFLVGSFALQTKTAWADSERISSYTTYFSTDDKNRTENIRIATRLIDGVVIQAYGEFSFNQTVGRRTQEAGFKQAKIIVDGEYALGTGGGVCQVSTTLYNAALKSGLEILEYHPHSLQVSYIAPSRDAMVSTGSDLRIFNAHDYPVTLRAQADKGAVRVCFYGQKDGYRYEIVSQTIAEIPPPTPIVKDGEREEILRSPKNGVKSVAYIERYFGDKLVSRKKLREDEYRPIQGIIVKKIGNTTN